MLTEGFGQSAPQVLVFGGESSSAVVGVTEVGDDGGHRGADDQTVEHRQQQGEHDTEQDPADVGGDGDVVAGAGRWVKRAVMTDDPFLRIWGTM
ncbi:hypothetical protein [Amycolatopsis anabasis]|uniref:hypothetical protein n=1 Tax=Amycolatopsis anabasis TaxID=1840409 RepID=UPI0015D40507|nr:hypothetical protein [Amycolatopsis anabasis]